MNFTILEGWNARSFPFLPGSTMCQPSKSPCCPSEPLCPAVDLLTLWRAEGSGFCDHVEPPVADIIRCGKCYTVRKKHAEKDCRIDSTRNNSLDTFKMVIFQVKLSTAFCSFRSFKPSLVPMLCKCSWNSMAERNKKTKRITSPSNLW